LSPPIEFVLCKEKLINVTNPLQQKEILKKYHENSNHKGITENLKEIQTRYYWPNLQNHLNKFINECRICLEAKNERKPINRPPTLHNPIGQHPFDHIYIDTITFDNTTYLTVIDSFSRYGQALFIESKNPIDIKFCLLEYFTQHNIPRTITSDNGKEFDNDLIKDFANDLNIDWHFNIPNRPQGRALVERFHSTLLENIRVLKTKNPILKIKEIVLKSVIYYNNTNHSTIKQKPFVVTHGYESDIMSRLPELREINQDDTIKRHINQIRILQNEILKPADNDEPCTPLPLGEKITLLKNQPKRLTRSSNPSILINKKRNSSLQTVRNFMNNN